MELKPKSFYSIYFLQHVSLLAYHKILGLEFQLIYIQYWKICLILCVDPTCKKTKTVQEKMLKSHAAVKCTENILQISRNVAWKLLSRKTKLLVHDTDGQVRSPVSYWFSVSGHRL